MAHAEVNLSLDMSGPKAKVKISPDRIEIDKQQVGLKFDADFENDFEVEIKDGCGLHFDMGKKSPKQKSSLNTSIKSAHQHTKAELRGRYTVRVFDSKGGLLAENDPDYIIRPRG
jgi:hypothetical protein